MDREFRTPIRDLVGQWPRGPEWMSFTSISEIEACPRRWFLRHASYPTVWARPNYPEAASNAALIGQVVHGVVEECLIAFSSAGCSSRDDARIVEALRGLGGLSAMLERGIEKVASELSTNPRCADRLEGLLANLRAHLPEMRRAAQMILAGFTFRPGLPDVRNHPSGGGAHHLSAGSHAEVDVRVPSIGVAGRIDLLTLDDDSCTIFELKTGIPTTAHAEQVRTYAVLWALDAEQNPRRREASHLVLVYPSSRVEIPVPHAGEIDALAREISGRAAQARAALNAWPKASPSESNCTWCPVRHMCNEYWSWLSGQEAATYGDAEVEIREQLGSGSWLTRISRAAGHSGKPAVLRDPRRRAEFRDGESVRLLAVAFDVRDELELFVVLTQPSESFRLADQTAPVNVK